MRSKSKQLTSTKIRVPRYMYLDLIWFRKTGKRWEVLLKRRVNKLREFIDRLGRQRKIPNVDLVNTVHHRIFRQSPDAVLCKHAPWGSRQKEDGIGEISFDTWYIYYDNDITFILKRGRITSFDTQWRVKIIVFFLCTDVELEISLDCAGTLKDGLANVPWYLQYVCLYANTQLWRNFELVQLNTFCFSSVQNPRLAFAANLVCPSVRGNNTHSTFYFFFIFFLHPFACSTRLLSTMDMFSPRIIVFINIEMSKLNWESAFVINWIWQHCWHATFEFGVFCHVIFPIGPELTIMEPCHCTETYMKNIWTYRDIYAI